MSLRKRGGVFHYDFTVNGKRYRGTTKQANERKAQNIENKLIGEATGNGSLSVQRCPRLRDFKPDFFKWAKEVVDNNRRKARTQRYYERGWKRIENTPLANTPLNLIDAKAIETLKLSGSPAYVNQAIRTVRRMLGKAEEWGKIIKAPKLPLLPEVGREIIMTPEYEAQLLAYAGPTLRDVIILIQDTGLRPDEIFRMRFEQVDWKEETYRNPDGKSKRARRTVPLSTRVVSLLKTRAKEKWEGWVFPSDSKCGHLTTVAKMFRRARTKAKLPKELVLYSGRHAYGTKVYEATGNLKLVMDSMGHGDVRTAMRYQHPEIEAVRAVIEARNEKQATSQSRHKTGWVQEGVVASA